MTRFRVLVADDNEDHLFFIIRGLGGVEGVEFEIEAVRDGEEALDFVHRRGPYVDKPRPHLILLDLRMPKMSGLEVLEALKSDPVLRTIPVSVLTSSDRSEDVQETYRLGANSYLHKDPNPARLRESLADVSHYWAETAVLPKPPNGDDHRWTGGSTGAGAD